MTPSQKAALIKTMAAYRGERPFPEGVTRETPGPGAESVWDFPRPPAVQEVAHRLRVVFAGETVAETTRGLRVVETAGAPVYFFPPADVASERLQQVGAEPSICEWKGVAAYFDLVVGARRSQNAAFCYPDPFDDLSQDDLGQDDPARDYRRIAGWAAFYANRVDAAFVGDEQATPQPGRFYAGWVTRGLCGPIKGTPGSERW